MRSGGPVNSRWATVDPAGILPSQRAGQSLAPLSRVLQLADQERISIETCHKDNLP